MGYSAKRMFYQGLNLTGQSVGPGEGTELIITDSKRAFWVGKGEPKHRFQEIGAMC